MLTGPDVSRHQGAVDMAAVARAGHTFVGIKATEGSDWIDPQFARNRANAAGLVRLLYHFARPSSGRATLGDARSEAAHYLDVIDTLQPGEIAVLDIEDDKATGDLSAWCITWCSYVETHTQRPAVLYTYGPYARAHLSDRRLAERPLWLAAYSARPPAPPPPWTRWTFWQWTSSGTCPGIVGRCDLNQFAGDRADLDRLAGLYTAASAAPSEDLLMSAARDDDDARRTLIRWWFRDYLGRGFRSGTFPNGKTYSAVDEQNLHVYVAATQGLDVALAGILDSDEAKAHAERAA